MKIRTGFVSNSSSSSFVAIAQVLDINDITEKMLTDKYIISVGKWLNDGIDIIEIKPEMLTFFKLIKSYNNYGDSEFKFYEIVNNGECDLIFSKNDLQDDTEYTVISYEADYHVSTTLDSLINRYTDDDQALRNKIYREKKLEKINKDED